MKPSLNCSRPFGGVKSKYNKNIFIYKQSNNDKLIKSKRDTRCVCILYRNGCQWVKVHEEQYLESGYPNDALAGFNGEENILSHLETEYPVALEMFTLIQ